jgi:hypothetical protein
MVAVYRALAVPCHCGGIECEFLAFLGKYWLPTRQSLCGEAEGEGGTGRVGFLGFF